MVAITPLLGVPVSIPGIINVQGKIVPVLDLRLRFGLSKRPYTLQTPLILVDLARDGRLLGLVVDTVEKVLEISPHNLEQAEAIIPPELDGEMTTKAAYLTGVAKVEQRMILTINAHALLTQTEQHQLIEAVASGNGKDN
jgi:purine-binding chemotaxis protein CheW